MHAIFSIRDWVEVCGSFSVQTPRQLQDRLLLSRSIFTAMHGAESAWAQLMLVAHLARNWKNSETARANIVRPWRRVQLSQPRRATWQGTQPAILSLHAPYCAR